MPHPFAPERLCKELTAWLPSNAVLVTDTGHSGIWTGTMVDAKDPNQMFIRCAGSLAGHSRPPWGSSVPCPISPWCASLATAASTWYHRGELETAVRGNIHTVTIVNNTTR